MRLSRQIRNTKCHIRMTKLCYRLADIEDQISSSKENYMYKVESKVIRAIKDDPSTFYRYGRQKSNNKSSIGPLMKSDHNLTSDDKVMSDILAQQYAIVFSTPTYYITSDQFYMKLDGIQPKVPIELCEVIFTEENIKKALTNIDNSSAAGPDGVPPQILKCGGKFITDALSDIGLLSMDENIPDILKTMWISPTWKGGPRCDPAE